MGKYSLFVLDIPQYLLLGLRYHGIRPNQFNFMLLEADQPNFCKMSFRNDRLSRPVLALVWEGIEIRPTLAHMELLQSGLVRVTRWLPPTCGSVFK